MIGNQKPQIHIAQKYSKSLGDKAILLAEALSRKLDPWEEDVTRDWMATNSKTKKWVHIRNGVAVPRQNGKSLLIEIREVYGTLFLGEKILYTAHDYSTVANLFERMRFYFGASANDPDANFPEINFRVAKISKTNGKEAIYLKNGACIYFSTRTDSSKRGFTVDLVIVDESQELTDEQLKAIMSTASSAPLGNPQYIFAGTPPSPKTSGDVFAHIRAGVLSGGKKDISWNEWSVDEIGDVSDQKRWYATNPALGIRLSLDVITAEMDSMQALSFAQERLGYWLPAQELKSAIKKPAWDACITKTPPKTGRIAYAVKFSPDGSTVSLAAAIRPQDQPIHIEVVENRLMSAGISWLSEWLLERRRKAAVIVVDGLTGAPTLVEMLRDGGIKNKKAIIVPRAGDMIAAASMLLNAVNEGKMTHFNQPALNGSALKSEKRRIGVKGGWGFGSQTVDSSLIEAAALAYWGVKTTKRNPIRKQVIG